MKPIALMYHHVIENGDYESSGFRGRAADLYKLERVLFARHLEPVRAAIGEKLVRLIEPSVESGAFLTFDDGGASAYGPIARLVEQCGCRAHFFVPTDWIGSKGFLNSGQILELDRRGHLIGSHSCSHPSMSHLTWHQMLSEWKLSTERLAEIVGHAVTAASVPGGYYLRKVAEAAAQAGIQPLFTSEPTAGVCVVEGCRVSGRFLVRRGMGPEWSAGLAAGKAGLRLRQMMLWKTKRGAEFVGGSIYRRARRAMLSPS